MNNNPYTTEYRISLIMKIFYAGLGLGMLVLGILFASLKWKQDAALKFLLVTCFVGLALLLLAQAFRRKVIITADSIIQVTFFKTKELPFNCIVGQRHEPKMIIIEPVSPEYPRLQINNYDEYAGSDQLSNWVKENFTDLNAADKAAEEEAIKESSGQQVETSEKLQQLGLAKKLAIGYTYISVLLSLGLMFIKTDSLNMVRLLLPLVGIALMLWKRGYIYFFTNTRRSIYPHVGMGILMSAAFAMVSITTGYHLGNDLHAFWLPAGIVAFCFGLLCYKGWSPAMKPVFVPAFFTVAASVLFAIGAVLTINCGYDRSAPAIYNQVVLEKYITKRKGTHYHIGIEPWKPYTKIQTVTVSQRFYRQLQEGGLVQVNQRAGLLGIGWYRLSLPDLDQYIIPGK